MSKKSDACASMLRELRPGDRVRVDYVAAQEWLANNPNNNGGPWLEGTYCNIDLLSFAKLGVGTVWWRVDGGSNPHHRWPELGRRLRCHWAGVDCAYWVIEAHLVLVDGD